MLTCQISSPSVHSVVLWRQNPQISQFFGFRHFVVLPVDSKVERGCTTTNLALSNGIKIVYIPVLQGFHGEIAISGAQTLTFTSVTNKQTNKPVGLYGPIAPPVLNAPISDPRNDADATFLDPHICRRLPLHAAAASAQHCIGGRLLEWQTSKCISSISFVRIE